MGTIQERHFAIVTDTEDPEKRGRIKAASQTLAGSGVELPHWIEPAPFFSAVGGFGSLFTPTSGSTVELTVDVGDDVDEGRFERFLENPSMRWQPAPFTSQGGNNPLPAELVTNYPLRRGFKTPSGHYLVLDDKDGSEQVLLVHKNAGTFLALDADGSVLLMTKKGSMLFLDDRDNSKGAKLIDAFGNSLSMDANGLKAIDKFGNIIELKSGVIQIIAAGSGQVLVNAQNVSLKAGRVDIGDGAAEAIVLGDTFLTLFNAHFHSTGVGPSGPPDATMLMIAGTHTSVNNKVA